MNGNPIPTLTGKKIGKWKVGNLVPDARHTIYYCTCVCGHVGEIRGSHLLNGKSTQCRVCGSGTPRPNARLSVSGLCKKGHVIAKVGAVSVGKNHMCNLCRWSGYIKRTYGLTVEEYAELYKIQDGKCAICGKVLLLHSSLAMPQTEGVRAEIDHKHVPKKVKPQPPKRDTVRGLLCGGRYAGCNRKLGHVDNVLWLQAAASYLLDPPAQRLRK